MVETIKNPTAQIRKSDIGAGNLPPLVEGNYAVSTELDRPGQTLMVVFGGINEGIGMPVFEFKRITSDLPVKLVFLRDTSQAWYHGSLSGIGEGIPALVKYLRKICVEQGITNLICIGNSMGGYAALVVGSLLNAQNVLAFVPQTFISRWLRMRYLDRRWVKKIRHARTRPSALAEAFDLRSFLGEPGYSNATIFYDRTHRLDATHAHRLRHLPNTHIESVSGGHKAIQRLRDSGRLAEILRQTTMDDSFRS